MSYTKYVLSKTGWFPKWEPGANEVLDAANKVFEVKAKPNGYFYIFPQKNDLRYLRELVEIFKSNGIILRPHYSKHYGTFVFRVPNDGQRFVRDVMRVNNDRGEFQNVLKEYEKREHKVLFSNLIERIKRK